MEMNKKQVKSANEINNTDYGHQKYNFPT